MTSPAMTRFIEEVAAIVRAGGAEEEVTRKVAGRMKIAVKEPGLLAPGHLRTKGKGYALWPVHVAADGSFSVAAAVWDVGQITPIHDHGTWGVIGICQGAEHEERFAPATGNGKAPLRKLKEWDAGEGAVFICCTSDADIHRVSCGSKVPCVGLHVYGADIGKMRRRAYDERTGEAKEFVSGWG